MKEYYSRLFLKDGASKEEVKIAYRKLVKKFHPDKNLENVNEFSEEFKIIQEAYEKLMNYFDSNNSYESTSNETDIKKSSSKYAESGDTTGLVKSKAKYAGGVKEEDVDVLYNFALYTLLTLFVICSIYAIVANIKPSILPF